MLERFLIDRHDRPKFVADHVTTITKIARERAHAGRCLAVIQAFGQRVSWQNTVN
ncbi:hypothetical protein AAFG13_37685 [Bradyrhizobium sp. B124]|uniref:hypothetical protein n=1 Tax=Bradyrhizobium sp. B124 TaxID=3140245 RepID=UPI003182DBED